MRRKRPSNQGRAKLVVSSMAARCWHFKNAACRAKGRKLYGEAVENMATRIVAIGNGTFNPNLFDPVKIMLGRMVNKGRKY